MLDEAVDLPKESKADKDSNVTAFISDLTKFGNLTIKFNK